MIIVLGINGDYLGSYGFQLLLKGYNFETQSKLNSSRPSITGYKFDMSMRVCAKLKYLTSSSCQAGQKDKLETKKTDKIVYKILDCDLVIRLTHQNQIST